MRKLIALEPEVYEKLKNKHQVTDKMYFLNWMLKCKKS